jgi:hypothetical protein
MIRVVWRWWRGQGPNWRERFREAKLVEAIAAELEAESPARDMVEEGLIRR